jgi:hypothetical protein
LGDIRLGKRWPVAEDTWWAVDAFADYHETGAGTVGPSWTRYLLVDPHRAIIAERTVIRLLV